MNVCIIGGGPAGLYAALLLKTRHATWSVRVVERNGRGVTFGWGVVFSDETMENFAVADATSHEGIVNALVHWSDIDVFFRGEVIRSRGHGFSGISRRRLLDLLASRCDEVGVQLQYEYEVADVEVLRQSCDLLIGADGINSRVRGTYSSAFEPTIDNGKAHFIWLGTDKVFDAFTFYIRENDHGLFQVHAYPFEKGMGTFIVETDAKTWQNAGLHTCSAEETILYFQTLFADELAGASLFSNRSQWIQFQTIKNKRWHHKNVVLIGDAAHTAHFSIGSGTKLAMEDAILLEETLRNFDLDAKTDVPTALEHFEASRFVDVAKLQKTAKTSQEWFENISRYRYFDPIQFSAHLLMRSKRVTHGNLAERDPALIARLDEWFCKKEALEETRVPMFTPFSLRNLRLANRVVVSPMCQYSATDGRIDDWHLVHLGSRAVGGAGLIVAEMTAISAEARITPGCAGIYTDEHVEAWSKVTRFVHEHSASKIGLQLGHAGRKGSVTRPWEGDIPLVEGGWCTYSASEISAGPDFLLPTALSPADMKQILNDYVSATRKAEKAGFDLLEVHMAHGYLLSCFISPLANTRNDRYGGEIENRMRFPLEIFAAVRAEWPEAKPLTVRISATDWAPGGLNENDLLELTRMLKDAGCDLIDVSSGQTVHDATPEYGRMYQTKFAEQIRHEVGIPTMAVGAIQSAEQINTIISTGRADLCALARPHLTDPYFTLHAAAGKSLDYVAWPPQYASVKPDSEDGAG